MSASVARRPLPRRGIAGAAHAAAHRFLDAGRIEDGYELLSSCLATHDGDDSDWIHVHWHMAVFEIELGLIEDALHRFRRVILPASPHADDVLAIGEGVRAFAFAAGDHEAAVAALSVGLQT